MSDPRPTTIGELRAAEYAASAKAAATDAGILHGEDQRIAALLKNDGPDRPWHVREELGRTLSQGLGLARTKDAMAEALVQVKRLKPRAEQVRLDDRGKIFNTDLVTALELGSLVELAQTVIAGALARQESRGAHYRMDFPKRDDVNWMKHSVCHVGAEGPQLTYSPVVISRFPPK